MTTATTETKAGGRGGARGPRTYKDKPTDRERVLTESLSKKVKELTGRDVSPETCRAVRWTFSRWYEGDHGPNAPSARQSTAPCSTCGFFLKIAGAGRVVFGVCANEWSPSDGRVVSVDHGCGAHSETDGPRPGGEWVQSPPVVDETDLEIVAAQ